MKRFVLTFTCSDSFVAETLHDAILAFVEQLQNMRVGEIAESISVESESDVPE